MEPLLGDKYLGVSPVLLQRPSSRDGGYFQLSYYRQQMANYISTQLPDFSSLVSLPSIAIPAIPVFSQAKETLNRQFSVMIDSISTSLPSLFSSPERGSHKRKKHPEDEENDALKEEDQRPRTRSASTRVIKQPVSQMHKHHPSHHSAPTSPTAEVPPIPLARTPSSALSLSSFVEKVVQKSKSVSSPIQAETDTPDLKRIRIDDSEFKRTENDAEAVADQREAAPSVEHTDSSAPTDLHDRIDFFVQENVVDNTVHQVSFMCQAIKMYFTSLILIF
jgi:hypothetical protein